MASELSDGDLGDFDRSDVENTLATILASDSFAQADQLSKFLRFIVTKKLDGEAADIKAYSIAVDALGREESFDPQESAAVRVAAARLRQALALHNTTDEARSLPVQIVMEPGSYVPAFVKPSSLGLISASVDATSTNGRNDAGDAVNLAAIADSNVAKVTSPASGSWFSVSNSLLAMIGLFAVSALAISVYLLVKPTPQSSEQAKATSERTNVDASPAVEELLPIDIGRRPRISATMRMPSESYPNWFQTGELADSISVTVARFDDYQFLGVKKTDSLVSVPTKEVDYHIELTAYRRDDDVRFFVNLTRVRDSTVIWSTERLFERPQNIGERNVPVIVGTAYSAIASPYGVIYSDLAANPILRSELSCVISGYQYFYTKTTSRHEQARECAEELVKAGSRLPSIYAMLTFLYLDEYREDRNPRKRDPILAASQMALNAVKFGPQSARAYQALFAVHKVQGHTDAARAAAQRAVSLNPFDADLIGDYAAWLISVGDVDEGQKYLHRVAQLLEAHPAWLDFYRFLGAELSRDFEGAAQIASMMDMHRSLMLPIAVAIGAHSRGDQEAAKLAIAELVKNAPIYKTNPFEALRKRGFSDEIALQIVEKLKAAGLNVSP